MWWREASLQPGDDLRAEQRALDDAGVVVVLQGADDDLDASLGDAVARAIRTASNDRLRRVVPVHLDARAEARSLLGLQTLQGVAMYKHDAPTVAAELGRVVAALRVLWKARPRIALVGVVEESGDALESIQRRLAKHGDINLVDAASPDALARASRADFRLLLVGARTGGTATFKALLDEGARALKPLTFAPQHIRPAEIAEALALHARIDAGDAYGSVHAAVERALDHFTAWLKDWAVAAEGTEAALSPWERAYLRARRDKWRAGSHEGLREASRGRSIDRARLYVPLRAEASPWCHVDEQGALVVRDMLLGEGEAPEASLRAAEKRGAPWLESVVTHRALPCVVVEAEAGAGKTVLLQHLACTLASVHLGDAADDALLDRNGLAEGAPLLRVPLLIEARRIAEMLSEGTPSEVLSALAREVTDLVTESVTPAALQAGLVAGRYLVLVDSLDEVPGIALRVKLLDALVALRAQGWPFRLVLSTRPTAYTGLTVPAPFRAVRIAALDDDRADALVARWAEAMGEDAAYRRDAQAAVREVRARQGGDRDGGVAANPLLLTCTLLVYDQQRHLPDSLADLYERLVTILCRAKPTPGIAPETKRERLEHVCAAMQRAGGTALDVRDAAEALLQAAPELRTVDAATEALDHLAADTGLLRFVRERDARRRREGLVLRPWHRSFQEFLAARRLSADAGAVDDAVDRLVLGPDALALDPAWEDVLAFLVGVYGNQGRARAQGYVARLMAHGLGRAGGTTPARPGRLLGLAARCVAEYPVLFPDDNLREPLRQGIAVAFARDGATWPLADRLLALEALGRLGDPRLGVLWKDEGAWVHLPGGRFVFGDGESYESKPPREVDVAPFAMAWRPITVADYAPFVEAGGHHDDTFWEGVADDERSDEPDDWLSQRYHPNRPVTGVSWHDARAWCRWASTKGRRVIDLPTEIEWEYAARSGVSLVFPWGDDDPARGDDARANHDWGDGAPRHPTPVGAFPRGDRGGLVDLAGNVWEWTSSAWDDDKVPVRVMTEGALRVVRGGSWVVHARGLRCATRLGDHPRDRRAHLGFRVVVRGSR